MVKFVELTGFEPVTPSLRKMWSKPSDQGKQPTSAVLWRGCGTSQVRPRETRPDGVKSGASNARPIRGPSGGNAPQAKMSNLREAARCLSLLQLDSLKILALHPRDGESFAAYFSRLNEYLVNGITNIEVADMDESKSFEGGFQSVDGLGRPEPEPAAQVPGLVLLASKYCLFSRSSRGSSHSTKIESLSHWPPKFATETNVHRSRARVRATSSSRTSSSPGDSLFVGKCPPFSPSTNTCSACKLLAPMSEVTRIEARTRELLEAAGFSSVRTEEVQVRFAFHDVDDYEQWVVDVAGPFAMVLRGLPEAERQMLKDRPSEAFMPFVVGARYELPGVALCAVAT